MLPFCGGLAPFPVGPAMLARMTGVPIVPVFSVFLGSDRRQVTIIYESPIEVPKSADRDADLRAGMAQVVAVYERYVRLYPEQWFNFYDFWRAPAVPASSEDARTPAPTLPRS